MLPDAPRIETLHGALKRATGDAHRALEALPLMRAVAAGEVGPAAYTDYLQKHWRLHAGLEPLLIAALAPATAAGRVGKTAWLEDDLQALGVARPADAIQPAPFPGPDAALGALYVLEGATLGLGAVLKQLPPGHPAHGGAGRFMAGHGRATAARWRGFLEGLAAVEPAAWPAVCAGAQATFALFLDAFAPPER